MGNSSSSPVVPNGQQRPNSAEKFSAPDHTVAADQTGVYPQLILFGDSITQNATLTLQPRLQALYVRRADVINRGFSGYNSHLALKSLPYFLPISPSIPTTSQASVRLVTLFLGANDAALPCYAQHVPLSLYTANLERIVQYVLSQQHSTKIVVITPAPVDEWQLEKPLTRTAINTQRYARAAKELATKLNLPCIDLWAAFTELCGYEDTPRQALVGHTQVENKNPDESGVAEDQTSMRSLAAATNGTSDALKALPGSLLAPRNEVLASLLKDGLHFTPQGYDVLYNELVTVIRDQVPECLPENMPSIFEPWRDILGVPKRTSDNNRVTTNPPVDIEPATTALPPLSGIENGSDTRPPTLGAAGEIQANIPSTEPSGHETQVEVKLDDRTQPHIHSDPHGEKHVGNGIYA